MLDVRSWERVLAVLVCAAALGLATACADESAAPASPVCAVVDRDYTEDLRKLAQAPPEERSDLRGIMLLFTYPETFVSDAPDRRSAQAVRDGIESAPLDPTQTRQAEAAFQKLQRTSDC